MDTHCTFSSALLAGLKVKSETSETFPERFQDQALWGTQALPGCQQLCVVKLHWMAGVAFHLCLPAQIEPVCYQEPMFAQVCLSLQIFSLPVKLPVELGALATLTWSGCLGYFFVSFLLKKGLGN